MEGRGWRTFQVTLSVCTTLAVMDEELLSGIHSEGR